MSDEIKIEATIGEAHEGDVPADAEVVEGQSPTGTMEVDGEEVQGRQCWHHRPSYRIVICPYHDCHCANRIGFHVHWVHCWNCHRNFHAH